MAKAAAGDTSYPCSRDGDFILSRLDFPFWHS